MYKQGGKCWLHVLLYKSMEPASKSFDNIRVSLLLMAWYNGGKLLVSSDTFRLLVTLLKEEANMIMSKHLIRNSACTNAVTLMSSWFNTVVGWVLLINSDL